MSVHIHVHSFTFHRMTVGHFCGRSLLHAWNQEAYGLNLISLLGFQTMLVISLLILLIKNCTCTGTVCTFKGVLPKASIF